MYITPYYRNGFGSLFNQIDRIFENAFDQDLQPQRAPLRIYEREDGYVASIDAPGFSKEVFEIDVERSAIRVRAQAESEGFERKLERTFRVPESVDNAGIVAKYENGVLTLELPKKPAALAQKITVK